MILAIPVKNNSKDTLINKSFGRAPYFCIIDLEKNAKHFIPNNAANDNGGVGVKASQILVDQNVEAVILPQCGENAAKVFEAAKIKIYKTINESIEDNIEAYHKQELSLLDDIHAGHHGA